ncbi:helix-turn-helix transcriptional regulator [Oxalobacteraceae sp. CFBP 13708]|nr:helix-turn-helix transcriptional regulator [Oxalobacteraceae sp. CFBP 13708]
MNELRIELAEEFKDAEYAHAYLEENSNMRIAAQIRALRIARGWTQEDLAIAASMKQARVSKIESADFDSLTLKTLRKLAQAFDVNLFVSFNSISDAVTDFIGLSKERLICESREVSLAKILVVNSAAVLNAPTSAVSKPLMVPAASSTSNLTSLRIGA